MITARVKEEKFLVTVQAIYQIIHKVWRITKLFYNAWLQKLEIILANRFFFLSDFLKRLFDKFYPTGVYSYIMT